MASNHWYDSATDLRKFGNALIDAGVLNDTEDVQAFLNKPQQYNSVYDAWEAAGFPDEDDDNWDEFVEAISDESEDESE